MHFNVPQFIDVEDKIAFQLTVKQLGWFALGGVILYFIWQTMIPFVFYVWVVIIGLLATAFAFYKPHGLPFHTFLGSAFMYLVKPKIMVWNRKGDGGKQEKKMPAKKKKEPIVDLYMKEKQLKNLPGVAKHQL